MSDRQGRVTIEQIWRGACAERLGMGYEEFDEAVSELIEQGKAGRDRPELPPPLDHNPDWRVCPQRARP